MGRLLSIYLRLAVLVAVGARVGVVQAAPPGATQTAAPFLSLTDNVGEPNDVGWCIDLEGHGDSITFTNMHVHSCKDSGTDVQWFPESGRIKGVGDGDGRCIQAQSTSNGAGVDAPTCDEAEALQEFVYCTDGTLRTENLGLCLVAGPTMIEAGPWNKRDLLVKNCTEVHTKLREWS